MTRIAALTGGTGFLGRHAIRALADDGWRIRMLARRAPNLPELADIEIEIVMGDLADAAALMRLCDGAEAIIHIAGVVKAPTRADFFRANATGAASVAAAWTQVAPDARFTLVSSMAARKPHLSHYAASKREGERMTAEIGAGRDWRILRPGAIYGAHDEETLKVLKLAKGPVQIMLNAAEARVSLIDARDAARAIAALAAHPGDGATYELTDQRTEGYRWDELVSIAAASLGRAPRAVRLPAALLRAAGKVGDGLASLTGSAEMLTSAKVRELLHPDWSSTPARQPEATLWRPEIPLDKGLADMAAWAKSAGKL